MTLVIMAAGMGSRFGGLKQIEPVGRNNEFIIDYSIYDALKNGFNKVVFIIKEENYDLFRETVGKRIENITQVEYVFQNNNNLPSNVCVPINRTKPLGTAHAILCAKDIVKEDFMIINADDFYGEDAYNVASNFLKEKHSENDFALVGYKLGNTVSENGSVKRGVCKSKDEYITNIIESKIEKENDKYIAYPLNNDNSFEVFNDTLVSMNMIIFTPKIFEYIEKKFVEFFDKNKENLEKAEFLIPQVVDELLNENKVTVKMLSTNAIWKGITYYEDKKELVNSINELIENKKYPEKLWN